MALKWGDKLRIFTASIFYSPSVLCNVFIVPFGFHISLWQSDVHVKNPFHSIRSVVFCKMQWFQVSCICRYDVVYLMRFMNTDSTPIGLNPFRPTWFSLSSTFALAMMMKPKKVNQVPMNQMWQWISRWTVERRKMFANGNENLR